MSAFANSLSAFQADHLTRDELLAEVHRSLAVDHVSPEQLRVDLSAAHAVKALPSDLRAAVLKQLGSWDPTITTPSAHLTTAYPTANQPPTIIIGERSNSAHALDTGGKTLRTPTVTVGAVLQGRFRLIALLGQGGMSRVFEAIDLRRIEAGSPDPNIAVKVLTVPFSHSFGSMAALQNEAHKLQRLTHQNIVRVMDCDREGQTVFMTMELLDGQSLFTKLQHSGEIPIEPSEAERIVICVAHALEFAHEHHIVHGDLKPGNVIVTNNGGVKVIDFGMARFIGGNQANASDPPAAMTPRYASPQMLEREPPAPTDDVYALACLAHEILTGRHPFATQLAAGARRDPEFRLERSPALTARQYKAISNGLAYERDKRTQSVSAFLEEFATPPPAILRSRIVWIAVLVLAALAASFLLRHGPAPVAPQATVAAANGIGPAVTPGTVFRDCPTCPLMTVVPRGHFTQGSAPDDPDAQSFERPQHLMTIERAFAIGTNEITIGEFKQFVDATGTGTLGCNIYDGEWRRKDDASWRNPGYATMPQDPVSCVSWKDAAAYAEWLTITTGQNYRLPSASEWEYAADAGSAALHPWKAEPDACTYANVADQSAGERYPGWNVFACKDGFVTVAPVGSFKSNAFGLNDMLGNVFEWVQDCWHDDYKNAPDDGLPRLDGACNERELRGGSWFTSPSFMRIAYRNRFEDTYRSSSVGFRVVREVAR